MSSWISQETTYLDFFYFMVRHIQELGYWLYWEVDEETEWQGVEWLGISRPVESWESLAVRLLGVPGGWGGGGMVVIWDALYEGHFGWDHSPRNWDRAKLSVSHWAVTKCLQVLTQQYSFSVTPPLITRWVASFAECAKDPPSITTF